ncbi:hypothetical protein AAC03nite_10110 [Alicyclobacillus acidoterrestris]|nr:hypothetical protein AAC03nite_10110 [Alicyclobacillus acidoterrestris]
MPDATASTTYAPAPSMCQRAAGGSQTPARKSCHDTRPVSSVGNQAMWIQHELARDTVVEFLVAARGLIE